MDIEKVNHILGKAVNRLLIEENNTLQQIVEEAGVGDDVDDSDSDTWTEEEQEQLEAELQALELDEKVMVKATSPGITGLKSGDWAEMGVSKLVKHFIGLGDKIGKSHAMKTILNIERWNKKQNPSLSKKARSVIDTLKKSKAWAGEDLEDVQLDDDAE